MKRSALILAALAVTLTLAGCGSRSIGNMIDDQFLGPEVASRISNAHADLSSPTSRIVVTSYNGVILLAGQTPRSELKDLAAHFALPVSCYVIGHFAVLTLLMKNSLLEQIGQDYVRTVLAKGGSLRRAVWFHAFRNALIPIATGFGGVLGILFAGSVLIEKVFEIPGMGRLSLDAIVSRDYMVFMGILAVTSVLGLLGRLLSDACYLWIDPRIQFD